MTLEDVKKANPGFFGEGLMTMLDDDEYEILPDPTGPVLRVTSQYGTRPVYAIDKETFELSCYLRHDPDVPVEVAEPCAD